MVKQWVGRREVDVKKFTLTTFPSWQSGYWIWHNPVYQTKSLPRLWLELLHWVRLKPIPQGAVSAHSSSSLAKFTATPLIASLPGTSVAQLCALGSPPSTNILAVASKTILGSTCATTRDWGTVTKDEYILGTNDKGRPIPYFSVR